ncbi:hypothetical protein CCR75_001238 [Bremia lactucae]|uniref:Uncharacterized protein n=1 Tax=Bremia lactucae TaxID=4779 RepID=A0A976IHX3_BRELC|nr:hypothetical protein CCR75_001238 [Bremia lactucae]
MAIPNRLLTFKGHRDSVNTLLCEEGVHPNLLASGGDDGTCRLWDLRTAKVTKCFNVKKALGTEDVSESAINSLAFGKASTCEDSAYIYVAAGDKILTFDVRNPALIVECADRAIFQHNDDEINVLSRHSGKSGKYLSVPDDSGNICVYDIENHGLFKILKGQHTNICSAAPFRPTAPWDLVSGGMDGLLLFWDFFRGRVKYSIDLNADVDELCSTSQQIFNPPLVHSLAFAPNGRSFVAGLGDASVAVVNFSSRQIVRRLKRHAAMVSQVHFPAFCPEDRLVSTANDAKVCIWNYQAAFSAPEVDNINYENDLASNSMILLEFSVKASPNAITTTSKQNMIVVADSSKEISAYFVR